MRSVTYVVQYETEIAGEFCEELELVITSQVELNRRQVTTILQTMHPNHDIILNDVQEQEYS